MVYVATPTEASPRLGWCAVLRSEIKGKRVAWQAEDIRGAERRTGLVLWTILVVWLMLYKQELLAHIFIGLQADLVGEKR